ncbi:hypothetical protein JMM81_10930 [Bacillus sp. V3B]|uniref:hypothetical protein n=1 Tax=Bacillus sp. V3B TaxID=2804915 RepID=UPI00210ECF51|nr:hypothetical protein [Bacillus sp. V3B]MCQ6275471.1 hypothetical protein [Bacillus sp. V3B]
MDVITWDKDDIQGTIDIMDEMLVANTIIQSLKNSDEVEKIKTKDAINICKLKLMGEYHGILVREMEEDIEDAEVYLITWDGEASDGGEIVRIDEGGIRSNRQGTLIYRWISSH